MVSEALRLAGFVQAHNPVETCPLWGQNSGLAIFSRFPIVHARSWQHLRSGPNYVFDRDCLEVDIEGPLGRLTLYVNHFKSMRAPNRTRALTAARRAALAAPVGVVHLPEARVEVLRVAVRPRFLRAAPAVGGGEGAAGGSSGLRWRETEATSASASSAEIRLWRCSASRSSTSTSKR